MGGKLRDLFLIKCFNDLVAYVNFASQGGSVIQWNTMDDSARDRFVLEEPNHKLIAFLKHHQVCLDEFFLDWIGQTDRPSWPVLQPAFAEYVCVRVRDEEMQTGDDILQPIIEDALIAAYPVVPILYGQPLHIGHLLHGLVKLGEKHCTGGCWSHLVAILDHSCSYCQVLECLQRSARMIFSIFCSQSHWAIAVTHKHMKITLLFDGQSNPVIEDKAKRWASLNSTDFKKVKVPEQSDQWSCGHRLLLVAEWFLENGWNNSIPESCLADDKIRGLSDLLQTLKREPIKREACQKTARAAETGPKLPEAKPTPAPPESSVPPPASSSPRTPSRCTKREIPENGNSPTMAPVKKTRKQTARGEAVPEKQNGQKISKQALKEQMKEMENSLSEKGLEHNDIFQKRHAFLQLAPQKGHWGKFLEQMVKGNEAFACKACQQLYDQFILGKEPEDVKPPQPPQPVEDHGLRKRGRPRKGERREAFLIDWIPKNRPGVYTAKMSSHNDFVYFCEPCQKDVNFNRDAITFLKLHEESCGSHHKGLYRMGLTLEGAEMPNRTPCSGARADAETSAFKALDYSLAAWHRAGQPFAIGDCNRKYFLESVAWRIQDDVFIVRHQECDGRISSGHCSLCESAVSNKKMAVEIASWGYRVDLAQLAYLAAYSSQSERQAFQELMQNRDYMKEGLAGHNFQELQDAGNRHLIFQVRRMVESAQKSARNYAYQDFINTRLRGLAEYSCGSNGETFSAMIQRFQNSYLGEGESFCKEEWVCCERARAILPGLSPCWPKFFSLEMLALSPVLAHPRFPNLHVVL